MARWFCFFLWAVVAVAWAAPEARSAEKTDKPDAAQAEFDRVEKMSLELQQAWLQRLERRADRAAKLTLSPYEAEAQQKRTNAFLHQQMVSWKTLREVVEDTDRREKEAVALLAQQYEDQGGRRGEWAKVRDEWEKNGSPFDGQDRLLDWLESSIAQLKAKPAAAEPAQVAQKPEANQPLPQSPAQPRRPHEVRRPTQPVDGGAGATVAVDVPELEARIAGCNLALREFEAGLDEKGEWDVERLESLVDRLGILVVRRNDLNLFRDLVPDDQKASIGQVQPAKSAISQLSSRVVEVRKDIESPRSSGDQQQKQDALDRLEKISKRLAEMSQE